MYNRLCTGSISKSEIGLSPFEENPCITVKWDLDVIGRLLNYKCSLTKEEKRSASGSSGKEKLPFVLVLCPEATSPALLWGKMEEEEAS